jgi:hypothetical protein
MIRLAGSNLRTPLLRRMIPRSTVAASTIGSTIGTTSSVPRIGLVGQTRALGAVAGSTEDTSVPAFRWAAGIAALVAAGAVSGATALCEKVDDKVTTDPVADEATTDSAVPKADAVEEGYILVEPDEVVVEEEEDPYANLPEEDEETSCSMCNTFRKGPCRPSWRKLERCFKDHEAEENGAVKCMRYFKPHSDCLMDYTNLYHLISLDFKQEFVEDSQLSVTPEERKTWAPTVDWTNWIMFNREAGDDFQQTIPVEDKTTPLWQRIPEDTEPVLITVVTNLPKQQEESGLLLKAAYAVDQDGRVLGFTFSKDYGDKLQQIREAAAEKEAPTSDDKEAPTSDEKEPPTTDEKETPTSDEKEPEQEKKVKASDPTVMPFDFFLVPGSTTDVRVCALYAEDPVTAPVAKDILDACLMESTTISLAEVIESAPSTLETITAALEQAGIGDKVEDIAEGFIAEEAPSTPSN